MCCSLSHNLARATEIFIYETLHKQPERQEQLRSMTFRVSGSMGQINNAILEIASYANSVACDRQAPANERLLTREPLDCNGSYRRSSMSKVVHCS